MNAVGRLGSYISRGVYTVSGPFHPFGGCVDIIVVEQQDGTFKSSPWYVRFGKFQGVLKTREKVVNISVNGSEANFHMYLDHKGEAYFLREVDEVGESESLLINSSSGDEEAEGAPRPQARDFGAGNGNVVTRNNSRRARILGLVFGRRSRKESDGGAESDIKRTDSLERAEFAANLLELKWSTNLDTNKPMIDIASRFCDPSALEGREGEDVDGSSSCVEENGLEVSSAVTIDRGVRTSNDVEDNSVELQVFRAKQADEEEEVFDRSGSGGVSSQRSVSQDSGTHKVQSFIYCESSESSIVRKDSSSEQTCETMYIASAESGELRIRSEVLRARTEPLSEDTVVEHLLEDYELEMPPVEGLGDCSDKNNPIRCCLSAHNVAVDEPLAELESCTRNPVLGSADDELSQDVCNVSSFNNPFPQPEDEENMKVEGSFGESRTSSESPGDCVPTEETNLTSSSGLEEEQLLFGDIDEFNTGEIQSTESGSPTNEATEKCLGDIEDAKDELKSPSEKFVNDSQSPDFESSTGNFQASSSPIAITGARKLADEEVTRLTESLPNMWTKIDSFEADNINCLSHSLDSNSKLLDWALQSTDLPRSIKSDGENEQQLVPEPSDMNDAVKTGEVKDLSSTALIEISLCKHLFYEGMGSDAASQAFDAEKLDLEKFSSLGPAVLKNDSLVVRINGSYFPWDTVAPMVLGMVSFGTMHIYEPKGKIAVDQVEKTVSGDPSSASASPGGNWRLWPFSFRRSRSRKSTQSDLSDVRSSGAETPLEVKIGVVQGKDVVESNVVKKMVRVPCPTSEQLASLNMKDGMNTVTFTFLTPMLGKQQVDARIYLWKWNTRIVISDVDGTITRSDVLGQFMPLVGVDWSHLGVAHLFSAIKENGYQLLFLSARAISQAYITRQFLFNLKQDGKALPDGPVVISPDGLFPSLYREVIRRAPHEFKIACLEEIRSLFPSDCNPFYAGFGNRDTDEVSYLKVGIPKGKIFIINPKGEVAVNRRVDTKSYKSIHALVNGMFPPTASSEQEDYNSWNFWKLPPLVIDE